MAHPHSGPVRSEAAHAAILKAASDMLHEVGYDKMTIEGIAARAGVGKQTIYRWWPSRSAIVAEALIEGVILPDQLLVPDSGDIRADLRAWLRDVASVIEDETRAETVRSIITAATHNPDIADHLRDIVIPASALEDRLDRSRGETPNLRPDTPMHMIADMILGTIVVRILGHQRLDERAIDELLTATLG